MTTAKDFDQIAKGLRWKPRSLNVVRNVLVDGMSIEASAMLNHMTTNQVRVHLNRFTEKARAATLIKVSAEEYMAGKPTLNTFFRELTKLRAAGYSDLLLMDFLSQNGVTITNEELHDFLNSKGGKRDGNENAHAGKSKGRRR